MWWNIEVSNGKGVVYAKTGFTDPLTARKRAEEALAAYGTPNGVAAVTKWAGSPNSPVKVATDNFMADCGWWSQDEQVRAAVAPAAFTT